MKKIKFLLLFLIFTLGLFFAQNTSYAADLDEILNYDIEISVNEDASLDMIYTIEWKVLDSDSEGPLTWAKIGLPNNHIEKIQAVTQNIDHIETNMNGGAWANVYFKDSYYKGDTVKFVFKIVNQHYMYQMHEDETTTYYFTPGWFDEINVDNLEIRWYSDSSAKAISPNATYSDRHYTWKTALNKGDKYNIEITYKTSEYGFDEEHQRIVDDEDDGSWIILVILLIIVVVIVLVVIIADDGGYGGGSGFGGSSYRGSSHSSYHSSCAHSSCACACACACAGGGRAGCSQKDFYKTNLKLSHLKPNHKIFGRK